MELVTYLPEIEWIIDSEESITAKDFTVVYQIARGWFEVEGVDYDVYELKAGQTPEDIAKAMYGDPKLYWIILIANRIVDPRAQWFLNDNQLLNFAFDKYYVKVYDEDKNWDDEKSAIITFEYLDWVGEAGNDFFYEPINCYNEDGSPIKLLAHHFENELGDWIPHLAVGGFPISNISYENSENLKRRFIRLPSRENVNELLSSLRNA